MQQPIIAVAPMQGFTDAAYRNFHAAIYGCGDSTLYCTPFLRVESGEVRRRDVRELMSPLNEGLNILPQAIFRDVFELELLVDGISATGATAINLNLGCPFPPQVKKGRGAGLLLRPEVMAEVARFVNARPELTFSVKMRLGVTMPNQWREVIDMLNDMALSHVTIHPRVASQQYGGELHLREFDELCESLSHPVVFNGDIVTPAQIDERLSRAGVEGVMIGRGVLARPSLLAEWREGREWTEAERMSRVVELHSALYGHYADILCGDAQLLMKIKPFWEYLAPSLPHKVVKAIKKATSAAKYEAAIASL